MKNLLLIFLMLLLSACGQSKQGAAELASVRANQAESALRQPSQRELDRIAADLDIKYRLVTNIPGKHCDANQSEGKCFEVELSFTAGEAIEVNNWSIYFSQIAPVQSFESQEFTIKHLNGDLHRISLKDSFTGFKAGETKKLLFRANFWMLSESDALPNYMIYSEQLQARIIKSTRAKTDPETGLEALPFVEPIHDVEKQFKRNKQDATRWLSSKDLYQRNLALGQGTADVSRVIIPTPKHIRYVKDDNTGEHRLLDIRRGVKVDFGPLDKKAVNAALQRLESLGLAVSDTGKHQGIPLSLEVQADDSKVIGSYGLEITPDAIKITGVDANGVFNGLQSLASLMRIGAGELPLVSIEDEPHYGFRGLMVDVARNFHSKDFILDLLDQMAAYKLNKLHLHLGDDEGWRLEIPGLPELTQVGGRRCFDPQEQDCLIPQLGAGPDPDSTVNGYYSVADYQEILKAASERYIQVIPSLDMPGHSRAAVKAMTARYNKYLALEEYEKASQFQLHEIDDTSKYSSVQYYHDNTINVCLESSYAFVKEVMTQVQAMHRQAGQPIRRYHIGADETAGAWTESPACRAFIADNDAGITGADELGAYFIERVAGILAELDIETAAWSDGLSHTRKHKMPPVVQANAWGLLPWEGHKQAHELANRNWQVVVSTPDVMYFDFPYEADPKEHGYYWASRHTNTEKIFQFMPDNLPVHAEFWLDREDRPFVSDDTYIKDGQGKLLSAPLEEGRKFLGLQGQLWSENTRSDDLAEHKIFPRLLALAERAWHLPDWAVPYNYQGFKYSRETRAFDDNRRKARDNSWALFAAALGQKEFAKLERADISYRLPTVGAKIESGRLWANIAFPGLDIEYKLAGQNWQPYHGPVALNGINAGAAAPKIQVRSVSKNGKRRGRTTYVR
ncbi:carbohydate-binding domain-containing protein [Thalassomonas viridans]|uniref:beta-N-acetylhexosaminidase n=1 Tax=Thalassomonas viridans TaxID=137584 RepID=A0AAF0CB44_9GAMM|nr:family 20 glycosylhydrolase [Thalassomonas viridans]WDE07216.1 carbohydate-binding domain-containing protein [Thalassomonas viridans]